MVTRIKRCGAENCTGIIKVYQTFCSSCFKKLTNPTRDKLIKAKKYGMGLLLLEGMKEAKEQLKKVK